MNLRSLEALIHTATLVVKSDALDKDNRLLAEGATNGFAIGEGACFHLLATPQAVVKYSLMPKLYLGYPPLIKSRGIVSVNCPIVAADYPRYLEER